MTDTFAKVFRSMYSGSMYGAGMSVFAVWGWILAHKDEHGRVEINADVIAHELGGSTQEVDEAVTYLSAPDERSRSRDEEGRRIIHEKAFTYRVVNHTTYRLRGGRRYRRDPDQASKIYFIQCAGLVKIGRSRNPWARPWHPG